VTSFCSFTAAENERLIADLQHMCAAKESKKKLINFRKYLKARHKTNGSEVMF
jgi:hypothetical protein